ncbi:CRISPR-associated endonuclease Cas2 [Marinobacter persicus]|uniref:CRISPR-associated endoribonuclease Cas2 n=1 Tax=Marinobacter persicus TaxID=930118 RepID=A0A2S6G844_9GAMM|nr:CRISPR-associated endonuclease Cas2 [Marinobacter persicus]PPK52387.1 CRISPR-associated Cas2 family protein [Marinobacter persicus]PPK55363.1 CRISPR-associated Cas2 family protein [Marinobacter persicus]PPK59130.1 CRISPR-associated Cas2 family protein [Marinobacter persicus]
MMVLVTYDISLEDPAGPGRLRRVAKVCLDYGVRVQYSVFECEVDPAQWVVFRDQLLNIYDEEQDSLRFYKLGKNWKNRIEHHGAKPAPDIFRDSMIL